MKKITSLLLISIFFLGACVSPVNKKNELRQKDYVQSYVDANYVDLANYWDNNAEKMTIDFKSATYLKINEKDGIAEITVGNGPYYGLIELKRMSDTKTRIRCYSWGGMESIFNGWMTLLNNYKPLIH